MRNLIKIRRFGDHGPSFIPLPDADTARHHGRSPAMNKRILAPILATLLTILGIAAAPAAFSAPPLPVTPNPSVKVLDSANTINDPAWFTKAYAAGFRLYVMHSTAWGTCTPWYNTVHQLQMALDAGLKIAVYTRDPTCWQGGIDAAKAGDVDLTSQLQFFALDVETGGPVVTRDMVNGVIGMHVRPVIYTGSGMWPQMTNNSTASPTSRSGIPPFFLQSPTASVGKVDVGALLFLEAPPDTPWVRKLMTMSKRMSGRQRRRPYLL
jgi:hypothetical protein